MDLKGQIYNALRESFPQKDEIENLLGYIEQGTDFFTAPCSTVYHNNIEGGLAQHSWTVYELLKEKVEKFKLDTPARSVAICGLLHDLCKTNFYVSEKKWEIDPVNPVVKKPFPLKKDSNGRVLEWGEQDSKNYVYVDGWKVDDKFPIGHGEKSVIILQRFIKLTDEEAIAIRWHMIIDPSVNFDYPYGYPYNASIKKYPFLTLLQTADMEASQVVEGSKN